jgi:outer membrane protein assembly factor BamA
MRAVRNTLSISLFLAATATMAQVPPATQADSVQAAYAGPYVISGIVVEGNKSTKERVILREMLLREGDTIPTSEQLYYLIERSRQNVLNMSLFTSVTILPLYLSPREVFLTVTVGERWPFWPTPIFKYSDPNFNTWWLTKDFRRVYWGAFLYRYNMRGRNETLYAKVQVGYVKEFALRYRFPFIDKRQKVGLAFGVGYTLQDEITIGTRGGPEASEKNNRAFFKYPAQPTRTERKGDVEVTIRPAFDLKHAFRAGYVDARVLDTVQKVAPYYFTNGADQEAYFSLGYTFTYDLRDSRVFPRSGTYFDFKVDRYGLGFGGTNEPDLTTFYSTVLKAWRFGERWSIGGSLRGKVSLCDSLPYYNQVALGYDDYVRGYEYYVIDGRHFALGKLNMLWALLKPRDFVWKAMKSDNFRNLYLAVYFNPFVDFGYVWDDRYQMNGSNFLANELQMSAGIGLNVVTIYDQIMRIEYAVNTKDYSGFYLHFAQPF